MLVKVKSVSAGANAMSAWHEAYRRCLSSNAEGVVFPAGEYHFYAPGASRQFCYFSNNDCGIKAIVFHLSELHGFSLVADGARFVFHGRLCPVVVENCTDIHLKGLSIDFADDYTNDLDVLENLGDSAWVRLGGKYRVSGGRLHFLHDSEDNSSGLLRLTAYDGASGKITRQMPGASCKNRVLKRRGDALLLPLSLKADDPRCHFHMRHQERTNPGIVVDRSRDVSLEACTIHQAGGMGLLMQNTENILVDGLRVVPAPDRTVACTDDATHFSECSGALEMRNCELRDTLDDAVNIHGLYWKLRYRFGTYLLGCGHYQHLGLQDVRAGDVLELCKASTLRPYATLKVASFKNANPQYGFVTFDGSVPQDFCDGDIVRNMRAASLDARIAGCTIDNTHSRGILFTGIRHGVIEDNVIHTPGAGVHISGDMNFWFEAGPDEDVTIRHNRFELCNLTRTSTGLAQVTIAPELPAAVGDFRYHKRIVVSENTFVAESDAPVVYARSVSELVMEGNVVLVNGRAVPAKAETADC